MVNSPAIEVLKAELEFIEKGGYGRSVKTPWQPTAIFRESPSCLNLGDVARSPCSECLLIDFVPPEERAGDMPCHHIPLDSTGKTIDELERNDNQRETEDTVKNWLSETIKRLEAEALENPIA